MTSPVRPEDTALPDDARPAAPLFTLAQHGWVPSAAATGPWRADTLHGGPVSALAAVHAAQALGAPLSLARISVDFLGPLPAVPLRVRTRPVRTGRSFGVVEVGVWGGGAEVARASALGVRAAAVELPRQLPGEPTMPPRDSGLHSPAPRTGAPSFNTDAVDMVVVHDPANPYGDSAWTRLTTPLVDTAATPPWAAAVALADLTHGIGAALPPDLYRCVNLDLTVHLVRRPAGDWLALRARTRMGPDGRGTAEAVLLDEGGAFGTATQNLLITRE